MCRAIGWVAVAVLGSAAGPEDAGQDARLSQARAAMERARSLEADGKPEAARRSGERALALYEQVLGGAHPDVAAALDFLGVVSAERGLHGPAEQLLRRALEIREAALGKDQPMVAETLGHLALIHARQGLYAQAEASLLRALDIQQRAMGKDHPAVAETLVQLGSLYRAQRSYDQAESQWLRALQIIEASPDRGGLGRVLDDLASLYVEKGEYGRAGPFLQRARAACEKAACAAHTLAIMASFYAAQGRSGRARGLLENALAMQIATHGEDHPDVAKMLDLLAQISLVEGRLADALSYYDRTFAISEGRLRREALAFSESRLATFLHLLRDGEERLYALARRYPTDPGVTRLALTAALLFKGRSVEETANTSRAISGSLVPEDREAFERLRDLRGRLARLSLEGPGPLAPEEHRKHLEQIVQEGDALEASLAARSAPLRALRLLPPPREIVGRVAASLPGDGALVEIVEYADRPLLRSPGAPEPDSLQRYLALVLLPSGRIVSVDLGPAGPIDDGAARLRDALANGDASVAELARELHALAFKPLAKALAFSQRLYLAPDGQLGLVPFAALHDGARYLVDAFDLAYLTSGRDLLRPPEQTPADRPVVVFADPDFGASEAPVAARAGARGEAWTPLPGTRKEAEALRALLPQARLYLGRNATKERLLALPTPAVLHVATHGFFIEDSAPIPGGRGVDITGPSGGAVPAAGLPDPLLRSGLVLSPAQARTPNDAVVTALELAGLNLWGTQLVVLSACDTGRGDVKVGQGVYGLRRALVVAGAETVVMSLWKVNDETTHVLMRSYYRNLLAGQGRSGALRQAMLAMRERKPNPYFWAPFIAVGPDVPLRGLAPATGEHQ